MYRRRRRTVLGETLPWLIIGLVIEGFLIWADVSVVIPSGELLAHWGLLFTIAVVVPGTVLMFVISGVQRARAFHRFERMSLPELLDAAPAMASDPLAMRSDTIYGNDVQGWFEVLYGRILAAPPSQPDFASLTRRYVDLLKGLEAFLRDHWPDVQRGGPSLADVHQHGGELVSSVLDDPGRITLAGPPIEVTNLSGTLRWLGGIAREQAIYARTDEAAGWLAWNHWLFAELSVDAGGESRVTTSCTPARLRNEIERLSAG